MKVKVNRIRILGVLAGPHPGRRLRGRDLPAGLQGPGQGHGRQPGGEAGNLRGGQPEGQRLIDCDTLYIIVSFIFATPKLNMSSKLRCQLCIYHCHGANL